MAIGEKRETFTVTTSAVDKDFNADGGSVLVELTGAGGWDGTVDFQTTPDGSTFFNIPYINRATITPTPTVAQISSPTTATLYLLLGPLSQVRIACGAGTTGTLTVVYRTISMSDMVVAYLAAGTNAIGKLAANDGVDIGDVDVTSVTPMVPLEVAAQHEVAETGGADILASDITPTNTPCLFRIMVVLGTAGVFSAQLKNGGTTVVSKLNAGNSLLADCAYMFDILVHSGDTVNFQTDASGDVTLRVQEIVGGVQ